MFQRTLVQNNQEEPATIRSKTSIGKVVFGLSALAVCAKVFGFAEKVVIARFFGTSDTADVYFASMGIILSIVFFIKELVYPSLLPVFSDCLPKSYSLSGALFRKMFLSAGGFLAVIAVGMVAFSRFITGLFLPGFSESKQHITSNLLSVLSPGMFFLGLAIVSYTVLNARKRFLAAAWPDTVFKLFIVAGLVVLLPFFGIHSLAIVIGIGGLGCLLAQLYFIPETKSLFRFQKDVDDEGHFWKVLSLMGPLVVGVIFSHVNVLVDNMFASKLPGGQLSCLGYSKKLIDAILLIGPVALITVVYSQLSYLASTKDYEELTLLVGKIFRLLIYTCLPVTCLLIALKYPIVKCLFQRGHFGVDSTFKTSQAFMVYSAGLIVFSLETLLVYTFYALSDTKTPVKLGIVCVFLNIGLAILLLKHFEYLGIAAALIISKAIKIIMLIYGLCIKLKGLFDLSIVSFSARSIIATTAMWLIVKYLSGGNVTGSFLSDVLFNLVLPAIGGMLAFILCSCLLRIDELKEIMLLLRGKEIFGGVQRNK